MDLPPGTAKEGSIKLMEDILWSDPIMGEGREKAKRGAGTNFGEDVTREFLHNNNLMMLIRSHQMIDEGAKICKCLLIYPRIRTST
jgi:diadenosine tetraphosphatase ApaH/serine/threonine PP2A family protein phosphatase